MTGARGSPIPMAQLSPAQRGPIALAGDTQASLRSELVASRNGSIRGRQMN
jgi:hypothetical protein